MNGRMIAERWLYQKLSTLGYPVHQHPAPSGTQSPHITFGLITGSAGGPLNNLHQVQNIRYQVNVWHEGNSGALANRIASDVISKIAGAKPEIVGWSDTHGAYRGTMNGCQYRGIVPIAVEIVDGKTIQRSGSEFELQIRTG